LFLIFRRIIKFLIISGIIFGLGYSIILNSPVQKIIYPVLYPEYIFPYAERYQVDPYLVAAVIRAESRFSHTAESGSGAKGLMQIMADTAKWAAEQLKLDYDQEMLFDPEYNIRIGCWYLGQLFHNFQGNLVVVLASYNAGEGNVRKWLGKNLWDGRLSSLDRIPFTETRLYVYKVLKYYERYRALYKNNK
jgi:soluble lytic murein transglycosylase